MPMFWKKTAKSQLTPEQAAAQEAEVVAEQQEETTKAMKEVKRFERSVKDYQHFVLRLILFIIVLWILLYKIIGITVMPTADMYPRVDAGDLVLFYRLDKDVRAQDIIVIEKTTPNSPDQKQLYISRVVAMNGNTVDITDNARLVVNGNGMIESNIFYPTPRYEGYTEFPLTLGPDECFVLADSRNGGTDSRYFGPVKKSEIVGTVITIVRRNNL